jgi:hypothetical protein
MGQSQPIQPRALHIDFVITSSADAHLLEAKCCEKCGSKRFREAHRLAQSSGRDSIMFECADCGEYRL